uniref:Transporter n=1 Tax=Panagrolaimus sp. ES5 TaxID=591445 RepID=A0AC34FE99_9BILA
MGPDGGDGFIGDDNDERKLVEPHLPSIYPPFCQNIDENYVPQGDIEYPFEEITGSGDENKIRGNWGSNIDYYLAVFGFTFGLGNLWRFPYQWGTNGGVAYLIPYCVTFLVASLPILFMELSLGQFISLGPISVWKVSPLFKGIGISMVFISCIIAIYYNMITSWALFYLFNSIKPSLPWATCGNDWNSDNCTVWNRGAVAICKNMNGSLLINGTCVIVTENLDDSINASNPVYFPSSGIMPSTEYFHNEVLMISSGLVDFRTINWQLAICLLIAWAAVFLASFKGIKTSGKVWGEASVQVFYSLSTCSGGLIMLSSYNRFHNNVFRDIWIIGIVDLITSIFMTSLLFAAVGFVCHELDIAFDQFQLQDGVHLIFVFFSEAISKLPVAQLWSAFFFAMIALVIFNSELFIVECVVSSICDEFPERLRKNHRHVLTFVVSIFYLLGIPLCTAAGIYWIVLLESFAATWPLIIIAFFECMAILSFVWLEYKPAHYDSVTFPLWAHCVGWTISLSPVIITVFVAIYKFITASGTFAKRWRELLCPEDDWGPALAIHRAEKYPLQIPEAKKLLSTHDVFNSPKLTPVEKRNDSFDSEAKREARSRSRRETTVQTTKSYPHAERETII